MCAREVEGEYAQSHQSPRSHRTPRTYLKAKGKQVARTTRQGPLSAPPSCDIDNTHPALSLHAFHVHQAQTLSPHAPRTRTPITCVNFSVHHAHALHTHSRWFSMSTDSPSGDAKILTRNTQRMARLIEFCDTNGLERMGARQMTEGIPPRAPPNIRAIV